MTTDYTGSDAFPALINGPAPGEAVTAAAVNDPVLQVADRTIWLVNRMTGRASLLESVRSTSGYGDSGPADVQDMKAITSWTDIAPIALSTDSEVAPGDIITARILCHVRHKRADAGFLGLRIAVTYELSGVPTTATVTPRRWIGDSAASDVPYVPVELWVVLPIAATGGGTLEAKLQGKLTAGGDAGDELVVADPWSIEIEIMRPIEEP